MACCKLGGHLNWPLEVDLRLLCPQFELEGPCPNWSGSCVTTLTWKCAHPNQSHPSVSVWQLLVQTWVMSSQPGPQTDKREFAWKRSRQHGQGAMVPTRTCLSVLLSHRCLQATRRYLHYFSHGSFTALNQRGKIKDALSETSTKEILCLWWTWLPQFPVCCTAVCIGWVSGTFFGTYLSTSVGSQSPWVRT